VTVDKVGVVGFRSKAQCLCVSVGVQCLRRWKWRKGRKRIASRRGGGGGQEKEVGAKLDLKIFVKSNINRETEKMQLASRQGSEDEAVLRVTDCEHYMDE
jgi:hypothetical protein